MDTIQSVQGASLDELENQLKESQRIYGKMKQNLQGEILQNLISGALSFKLFFEARLGSRFSRSSCLHDYYVAMIFANTIHTLTNLGDRV